MRRLWIADIHANLPAFEATLADAGPTDEVVFLGDVVGYGPHPAACVDLLEQLGARAVVGNHDVAVLAIMGRTSRRSHPVDWNEWTFDQLSDAHLAYLATLPAEVSIDFCGSTATIMHHPSGAPYLHPAMPDAVLAEHLGTGGHSAIICGHSHRHIDRLLNGCRYVCVPPIGQPRNGDPRAGYAIEEDGVFTVRFVPYDLEQTAADIENIGLANAFCERWLRFLRTGWDVEWSREYR